MLGSGTVFSRYGMCLSVHASQFVMKSMSAAKSGNRLIRTCMQPQSQQIRIDMMEISCTHLEERV